VSRYYAHLGVANSASRSSPGILGP
jgi:hypothetical protein